MRFGDLDLLALGETMLALAPPAGQTVRDAARFDIDHAGAESNTCVGLARLGLRTAWLSRLGADAAGDRILAALEAEGIDTSFVVRDSARPTGMMIKDPEHGVRYYRSESAASTMRWEHFTEVPVAAARAVLVTGVTALIGPLPQAAGVALLEAARGLRIVDPNLRRGLWGSDRRAELVQPLVARCDLLLSGVDELAEIIGGDAGNTPALARQAASHGPREIVLRGRDRVCVRDPDGGWHEHPIVRGDAVDPIGAGDAFNAGYIAVRLRNGSIEDAVANGIRCGTAVTTALSDTSAFPRAES